MTMTMTFAAGLIPIIVAWSVSVGAFEGTPDRVATEAAPQKAVPAERIVEEYLFDLSEGALPFACSADGDPLPEGEGELVTLEGQLDQRFTLVSDGAGGYHFGLNTMPVAVRGTGETSGEEFRVTLIDHFVGSERGDQRSLAYRHELKMVARDTRRTFWVINKGHYLISADGEIIVVRDSVDVECRG